MNGLLGFLLGILLTSILMDAFDNNSLLAKAITKMPGESVLKHRATIRDEDDRWEYYIYPFRINMDKPDFSPIKYGYGKTPLEAIKNAI